MSKNPFNSKVIKSFVPELRSRKFFLCFGIPMCVMNIVCTFHIFMNGYVTWVDVRVIENSPNLGLEPHHVIIYCHFQNTRCVFYRPSQQGCNIFRGYLTIVYQAISVSTHFFPMRFQSIVLRRFYFDVLKSVFRRVLFIYSFIFLCFYFHRDIPIRYFPFFFYVKFCIVVKNLTGIIVLLLLGWWKKNIQY